MDKLGIVISEKNGMAKIAVNRTSGCGGGCKTCGGCDTPVMVVYLPNDVNAKPGDTVELSANNSRVVKFTIVLYLVPLIMFVLSLGISYSFYRNAGIAKYELYSFITGIFGFLLSLLVLKLIDKKVGNQDSHMMKVNRIVNRLS
ncbi:MAG: SoxR reducing system RseC family protein [Tissierellia bacterium]|nr:SoxR reducing system RseC family protein [Tissierellia bacterium]